MNASRWPVGPVGSLLALGLVVTAGCDSGSPSSHPSPPTRLTWVAVAAGSRPTQLASSAAGLLVAGDAGAGRRPTMTLLSGSGDATSVPVASSTYYGQRGRWHGVTTVGDRVYAFAGENGGAHDNVRWTTFSGSAGPGGLREDVQTFETFGGPDAGGLTAVVPVAGRPVIVGSWVGAGPGLDIATWRLSGRTWTRATSPAALTSTADAQATVRGATAAGADGLLITGAVSVFRRHRARLLPAIWTAPGVDGPWTRTVLDAGATVGQALSATCDDGTALTCWVLGGVDDTAAAWQVTISADGSVDVKPAEGLPAIPVAVTDTLAPPVLAPAGPIFALSKDGATVLVTQDEHGWATVAGPDGDPIDAVARDDRLYVTTRAKTGVTGLWSAAYPG